MPTERARDLGDLGEKLKRLTVGYKQKTARSDFPEAIYVMTLAEHLNTKIDNFARAYATLCEYSHPNHQGAAGLFSWPHPDTGLVDFGSNIRESDSHEGICLSNLSAAVMVFDYEWRHRQFDAGNCGPVRKGAQARSQSLMKISASSTDTIKVGFSTWMIGDRNFEHFKRGERTSFLLRFYPSNSPLDVPPGSLSINPPGVDRTAMRLVEGSDNMITAKLTDVFDDWSVIDAGILMYRAGVVPDDIKPGCWVSGKIYVGIDPFDYFERLS